ncbi:phospho-sugar glycosidase domain-containing protein, partial [Holdemania massiliensis]
LCITLDNELSGKYEGELQIALKSMPGVEYTNVIGQVDMLAENLISLIRYGKVAFRLVEAEKIQNATVAQHEN